jgi:hypothetical protein
MVVVGLDMSQARDALDRLAPIGPAEGLDAAERATTLELAPAGAGEAIASALEGGGAVRAPTGPATR